MTYMFIFSNDFMSYWSHFEYAVSLFFQIQAIMLIWFSQIQGYGVSFMAYKNEKLFSFIFLFLQISILQYQQVGIVRNKLINFEQEAQIIRDNNLEKNKMSLPRPKTFLIDEDEHLENLRKIIKRDFFQSNQQKQAQPKETIPLTLNNYLKNFKSNENHIFAELVHNDAEEWKSKHEWMDRTKQLMLQHGTSSKPFSNMIAKDPKIKAIDFSIVQQDPKNSIFFSPTRQTKSYNDPEHDKAKKVSYANCKIDSEEIQRAQQYRKRIIRDPNLQQIPSTPILQGRHKVHKNEPFPSDNKEYSMKRAPSPEPEVIPIMTWGQIQNTPMRIPEGPQYKIPQTSSRQILLEQLTTKIYKQKMIKKTKKSELRDKILSSVRSVVAGSSYRKVSIARQDSYRRFPKIEQKEKKQKFYGKK